MRNLDFSSLHALVSTLLGLTLITLLGVGIRLILMQTLQQRRERENRQINERLRTLIAAYKTLGGSFTGNLAVDPTHLRDLKRASFAVPAPVTDVEHTATASSADTGTPSNADTAGSDRSRRIRDAVEAALADIILLGTEEQVRLAARAASEMIEGRLIHTSELVVSLRSFIRDVLALDRLPAELVVPAQGPARQGGAKSTKDGGKEGQGSGGKGAGGGGGATGFGQTSGATTIHDDAASHHESVDDDEERKT
ncbi:hypothetical protein P3T18_000495 [Paraburkholderia sp. GAS199]|uniref:hypothetical protein n=1 Tax=Paraburkholderia sp. GAS199 TaxID=3035126 RepID=UPI003D25F6C1